MSSQGKAPLSRRYLARGQLFFAHVEKKVLTVRARRAKLLPMNILNASTHPVLNALLNAAVSLGYFAMWGILLVAAVAVCAMVLLSAVAEPGQSAASAACATTHRVEATAVHGLDGDRYIAIKVVGLDCPVMMHATVTQLAESARAKGYMADMVGVGEVHVRPNYARLAY